MPSPTPLLHDTITNFLSTGTWVEFDPSLPEIREFLERTRLSVLEQLKALIARGNELDQLTYHCRLAVLDHALSPGITKTSPNGSFMHLEASAYWEDALGNLHPERREPYQTCRIFCAELRQAYDWIAWCANCQKQNDDATGITRQPTYDIRRKPAAHAYRAAHRRSFKGR